MCELLIRAVDNVDPHSALLSARKWKRGDVVVIRDDGQPWTAKELSDRFFILKLPGIDRSYVFSLVEPEHSEKINLETGDIYDEIIRKRVKAIDLDAIMTDLSLFEQLENSTVARSTRLSALDGITIDKLAE